MTNDTIMWLGLCYVLGVFFFATFYSGLAQTPSSFKGGLLLGFFWWAILATLCVIGPFWGLYELGNWIYRRNNNSPMYGGKKPVYMDEWIRAVNIEDGTDGKQGRIDVLTFGNKDEIEVLASFPWTGSWEGKRKAEYNANLFIMSATRRCPNLNKKKDG